MKSLYNHVINVVPFVDGVLLTLIGALPVLHYAL